MRYFYSNNPQTLPLAGGIPGTPAHAQYSTTDAVLKLTTLTLRPVVNELPGSFQRNLAATTDATPGTPQQLGMTPIIPNQTELPLYAVHYWYDHGRKA